MITALYADGGVIGHNPSDIGGTWAWCHVDKDNARILTNSGVVLPRTNLPLITNNLTEMIALVKGIESLPEGWTGTVYSDSQITLGRVFWKWKLSGIPPILANQMAAAISRIDIAHCQAVLLGGHPTKAELASGVRSDGKPVSQHNVWCDEECGRQAKEYRAVLV